jgi:hypothetical protein
MPVVTRKAIYQAFFALLQQLNPESAGGNGTLASPVSRVFRPASECDLQPWMCLLQADEEVDYPIREGPSRRYMNAMVVLYCHANDPNTSPDDQLSDCIDATESVIRPDWQQATPREQTLGHLIRHIRFSGKTTEYSGSYLEQTVTVMQFSILATV